MWWFVSLILALHAVVCYSDSFPSIHEGAVQQLQIYEGSNALLTCIIRDAGNYTVLWMKEDRTEGNKNFKMLTAAYDLVTTDTRFAVMHDQGGDVWVLVIKDVKLNDTGTYICEVNSQPVVQSFHKLKVLSRGLLPPDNQTDPSLYETHKVQLIKKHNYTECCQANNVSQSCFGFCNIHSILEGNTGQDPENCENDFAAIVRCMADGRNHVPCCIQEGVPDICQDVCKGEYTVISDNIKTHFSCSSYTEKTLACIVDGIEYLPSPPGNVEVESLSQSSLEVFWEPSLSNADTITKYVINVTLLVKLGEGNFYEDDYDFLDSANTTTISPLINPAGKSMQIKVSRSESNYVIKGLSPFSMYEITVTAYNSHGSSLPSYAVRALTKIPGVSKPTNIENPPDLPDIKSCCIEKGITHKRCIDKLCEPTLADLTSVPDLMICAPWVESTLSCLVNGMDHTPCCKARGLSPHCQKLCGSNITHIDYSYFNCLKYMGEYTNCLMQGYGVLPSAPRLIHLSHVYVDFAIIQWEAPEYLGSTVPYYNIQYRMLKSYNHAYSIIHKVNSPYILEHLESDTHYEVFVEAVNAHGVGESSSRIVFSTIKRVIQDKIDEAASPNYNVTACCVEAGLDNHCLPLCSYDASISDIKNLASVCGNQLSTLIRCGAGGRNHTSCCSRRGVPSSCLPICSGVILGSLMSTASTCIPFIGNIVQCFEEGSELLPAPINELHVIEITNTSISLEWEAPADSNITDYVVYYQEVENATVPENFFKNKKEINTTLTSVKVENLVTKNFYKFYVLSRNQHGTSLPSSVLIIQAFESILSDKSGYGVPSPPHSLAISSHSATWVTISWQPPEFSLPTEHLYYKLHHKANNEATFQVIETSVTSHNLENLKPNSKYIVYVIAVSDKGQSLPSETLIAWTDPAFPAFVEPPTIHPNNIVIEGSNITVLCIAMGTPMPTVSLYVNGMFIRQEVTRHMVTFIQNVSRTMDQIACYADNGYGTPMQAFRKIHISHVPHIIASGITMAALGDSVTLECQVDSYPEPKMIFWRDYLGRIPVIQGGKYSFKMTRVKDGNEGTKYIMSLDINKISNVDQGEYFCHAENAFGSATQPVSVRIRNMATATNISQCCIEQNVTSPCMEACSFYLDIDAVINKPECIGDFNKLMRCAADGSDHRACCGQARIPRECLDWCRGHPNLNNTFCVLTFTKQIMNCFQEGRESLPGPPQNLSFVLLDSSSVLIKWDPPIKNPSTVEIYKVIWNKKDSDYYIKNDTRSNSIILTGLELGVVYECAVKAVNQLGMSIKSKSIQFSISDEYITSSANIQTSSHAGIAVAIIFGVLALISVTILGIWYFRRKLMGRKSPNGIAFENPSYLREVNMDHIQISPGQAQENNITPSSSTTNGIPTNSTTQGWKHETLHVPLQSNEIPPTFYEELKLGQDGVGFKRLK